MWLDLTKSTITYQQAGMRGIQTRTRPKALSCTTRLPPVVYDFRAADTIGRSRVKAKCVRLNDTTPAQVISLSVVMLGCSPGPSE